MKKITNIIIISFFTASTALMAQSIQKHISVNSCPVLKFAINAPPRPNTACIQPCNGSSAIAVIFTPAAVSPIYHWSNGSTTEIATALCAGTYTFSAQDVGCPVKDTTITIVQSPSTLNAFISSTDVSSCILCNGSATVTPTGGSYPYTYNWAGGQATATVSGLCSGNHIVTVTDGNRCSITDTIVIFCTTTGISNLQVDNAVKNFPNPSNGVFKIQMNNVQLPVDNYQLSIYNVMGEKVYSSLINNQSSVINLNVPNGTYFLQLKTEQGIETKKIIINK